MLMTKIGRQEISFYPSLFGIGPLSGDLREIHIFQAAYVNEKLKDLWKESLVSSEQIRKDR